MLILSQKNSVNAVFRFMTGDKLESVELNVTPVVNDFFLGSAVKYWSWFGSEHTILGVSIGLYAFNWTGWNPTSLKEFSDPDTPVPEVVLMKESTDILSSSYSRSTSSFSGCER